jgi:hypothetical protein
MAESKSAYPLIVFVHVPKTAGSSTIKKLPGRAGGGRGYETPFFRMILTLFVCFPPHVPPRRTRLESLSDKHLLKPTRREGAHPWRRATGRPAALRAPRAQNSGSWRYRRRFAGDRAARPGGVDHCDRASRANWRGHRRKHARRSFGQWSRRSPSPRSPDYCRSSCIGKVATIRVKPWPRIERANIVGKPVQRPSN